MPGVTTRVTSRFTSAPFPGSSTWSQMATLNPFSRRRATYPRAEWYGTPHMGTLLSSFERDVSVICSASDAVSASWKNIS